MSFICFRAKRSSSFLQAAFEHYLLSPRTCSQKYRFVFSNYILLPRVIIFVVYTPNLRAIHKNWKIYKQLNILLRTSTDNLRKIKVTTSCKNGCSGFLLVSQRFLWHAECNQKWLFYKGVELIIFFAVMYGVSHSIPELANQNAWKELEDPTPRVDMIGTLGRTMPFFSV